MKPLVLAIVVAGAVGLVGGYVVGRDEGGPAGDSNAFTKTFVDEIGTHYEYTLHDGDVIFRPEAGARCEAFGEGGTPNLFCTRVGGGRYQVIFYKDDVLVWPLDCPNCGPDGPVYTYRWAEELKAK